MFTLIVESGCTVQNTASADTRFYRYSAPVSAVLITVSHTIQNLLNKRTGTLNLFHEEYFWKFIAFCGIRHWTLRRYMTPVHILLSCFLRFVLVLASDIRVGLL